ncbi:MAG: MBL fold metallo-hydrolase [Coriobacteriia bacterium]|nr:MBL fold metallo-hydrolase [Coriobacteriia bacterium]
MRLVFLGSGSSGNATAIECGGSIVLIDAGFSARETLRRMCLVSLNPDDVRAILLTHEHTDHISGVRVLSKRLGVPVFATAGTLSAGRVAGSITDPRTIRAGDDFSIGSLGVSALQVSHDAAEPVGFRIESACGSIIGLATDTGTLPTNHDALGGCDVLAIECNHDEEMLENGPYPWFLKERIKSHRGHLSNTAALEVIGELAHDGLKAVVGLHLSRQNNCGEKVIDALSRRIDDLGLAAEVHVVAQQGICTLTLGE